MDNKLNELIDKYAKNLVGILCKRVEVLEKEKALTPSLYKALVKETIYENTRNLKAFLEVYINIGTVKFIESNDNSEKE
jgi:hypothetical protein